MATEEEAREVADGEEVQVQAADLGTTHLQMNLHGKLSSHEEIKDEAKIMDSTKGLLKVTEDQVSEKAPCVAEIPLEHTPNGTASSLNSHMKEVKISNEKPQENGQKDNEQVEASTDGVSTEQSNKSNGEAAVNSFGDVESTADDTSLLKYENEVPKEDVEGAAVGDKMVHKDTLQPDEATIDAQQGQNLEPEEVTEGTNYTSMSCPHDEVVAKAPAGVQTSLEPKVDDSDALPDTSDGNTETEAAKVDKESFPEDEDIADHTNEIIKLEDQPSKQTDDVDAEVVQEEVPKGKQTDVPEDLTKTEQADESTKGDEELNQESPVQSTDPVRETTEETSHESNVSASKETSPEHDGTTMEPALDVQEAQNQGLAEEIADAKEVDTEKTVQQSGVAFEEATPEDTVATIEQSSDIQHVNNVKSEETKGLEDAKAEETSNESNVAVAEDAGQDKKATNDIQPEQGLEEEPKSTETVEMDEASSQAHANALNNLAEEDGVPACQPLVIDLEEEVKDARVTETQETTQQSHVAASEELEDNSMAVESRNDDIQHTLEQGSVEVKDTEASETQEICHERTISASKEDSVEDDVTAEGPTSDAQGVENVESVEEIKDNTADNIVEASNVATVEEADQEKNVLTSEDVSEQQTRGLEPEEIQNTEPIETEEASDQRHPALLNGHAPEDTIPSEMLKTESTEEVKETEATKTEALPQESNVSTSEEPASKENIIATEITCDAQEVENSEQAEEAEGNKDAGTKEISDQSNDVFAREEAQVTSEPAVDVQSVQEVSETNKNAGLTEVNEASGQMDAAVLENPTHEDNQTTSESLVMESAEVSSSGATEGQEMPQHEVTQSEDHEIEENTTESEPKILEPEPAEEMGDGEATEPRSIAQQSIVSSSEESVPEEDVTAKEPASDIKEVQSEEPELTEEQNDVKAGEISNQSSGTTVGETAQENLELLTDETPDVKSPDAIAEEETPDGHVQEFAAPVDIPPVEDPELEETKTTEPVEVHDNVMTNDLPAGEVNDTQATEIAEIHNESGDLTEDVKSNVVLSYDAAPAEDAKATEASADIPQAQDPELEEIKNNEPVEVEDNIIARDLPEEEIKDTEAMETEVIPDESTSAKITEFSNDAKSNVALAEEAAPEEHVIETEARIDMPRAQVPELEEIKNAEPLGVEENISTTDQLAEEIKATEAMETETINESTDANSSELIEDVKRNLALEDEAAHEEHIIAANATVHKLQAQEPELEEIKNTEPVEVKENIPESDLPAEEAKETEVVSKSTDANISEPTEDARRNAALADEATSEDHIIATEATVDIPRAQEPELEEIENTERVEVEENISANDLPAEENFIENEPQMTGIEPTRPEPTPHESNVASLEEMATEDNTTILADVTIQQLQEEEPIEFRDTEATEPQGISQSHIASTSEESTPENNVATEPSPDTQAENSESAAVTEETRDVKSTETIAEEETPEELVHEFEAPVDIPPVEEPELEENKNTEPVEVHDNVVTNDLTAEEVKNTEATEIAEIHNESGDLTEDAKSNAALADEAAPDKHAKATEATADISQAEEPELEEIKNSEPVEVEDNILASDVPEEIKDTEAMETEMIPDGSTEANSIKLTNDVKNNVALAEEAASEEDVIETEATIDIPRAQEPELEDIKNTEPIEVEENISASDQSAEEIRVTEATETEAINESIDANSSKLTEDVKENFAHEEHAMAAETTVHIPRAQEPELEEIKNTEPVEVKEDISASDLPAEEVKETEEISESTDANTSELTEDAETHVALADEPAPEEHVTATEVKVDIPRAQEPEIEETDNAEHVEMEENISANDLPAEEVKDTETMETEAINDGNITELPEDVTLADEGVPPVQKPAVEEIKNTEPVEAEDIITADDTPAEELIDTEAMETEEITHESTDDSLTEIEPFADIQQVQEQEAVEDKKCTDTTENQEEPQQSIASTADELTPTEEETTVTEPTQDTHVRNVTTAPTDEEIADSEHVKNQEFSDHIICTAEVAAQESPLLGGEVASNVHQVLERDSTEETREIEAVQTEDDHQHGVSNLEKPMSENNVSEGEQTVADQEVQEDKSAEVEDTEAMGTENISIQDNIPTIENAAQESSEPGSDPDLLVQSEDSKDQLVNAEERGQSNGATLEEPTAGDNAANEIDPLSDTKQEHELESEEGNKGIDATEGEEASHPSQDASLEKLVSESNVATTEPTSDIQQANDLDDTEETTATKAINNEELSCTKTEVATLEDPSPIDNGTSPKENSVELDEETLGNEISNAEPKEQKDESSDLGEKTAFTTQEGESPTEEDVIHISGEDTVGTSNNIEQIKEQSKSPIEHDAIKNGDHTNDQDDEQLHNVEHQMQVCERSVDVSAIEQPDEDVQKVNLDQQNEDEVIDKQTEEIQRDEQKHDDSSTDLTTETLLEPQSSEIGTENSDEGIDVSEAEQTETVATEMLMNEQTIHIPQGSIPSIADVKVENSTEIEETPEQENAANNTDAEDEKENIAKPSTDEHDGANDVTINEEVGNGLASPIEKDLQQTSNPAPSNEETLGNSPTVVPQNVEPEVHREEEECINKVNDDMQAIQASEEEIVDEVGKKQEMQNEDTDVNNDEIQTKPIDDESSELHSSDSTDTKMDDTMRPYAEMVHGSVDTQPTDIEEVEGNKGFSSISEHVVEKSEQNDVEHDLSIHTKVVDDNLEKGEQIGAEVETNLNEEMAASSTAVTGAVKFDEANDNKASGADGALSDENLETFEDNRTNLEASSVVTALGESMNEDKEHHNLPHPAYSAVDGNTTEQASGSEVTERGLLFPEKPLPTESEVHEESQTTKEQDEEAIHEQETGDTEKEDEQSDLPVSNFLMNLIMGKESTEPDRNSEPEAENKQEETTKDDSCLITSQQEESSVPVPTENKVENKLISEQGKHNLEGSEETHDFKLESDDLSRNTHNLEAPVCQNNVQGEISSELVPGGPGLTTELETRDVNLGEKASNSGEGSLNLDDSTNPKDSQEDTLEEGRTELRHESLPEDINAVVGHTLLSAEPDPSDEKKLPNDTDDLQSPLSTKGEEATESSIIEAGSTIEAELENEVKKEEEIQHSTITGRATEGHTENLHDNSPKGTKAISDEQTAESTEPVMGTEINLVHEKEISAGSECEEEKQSSKLSNSELHNSEKALDIQSDGSSLHINQDKQDEFAGDLVMEKNNLLDKPGESNLHEEQDTEIGQESPKESDGGDQNCLAIREPVIKEENANRSVESHVQTVMSQVQERGLDVVSAKESPEAEENVAKPEFSTDEEQIPKEDKSNMAEEKTKDEEEAKSFTDEATMKIEGAIHNVSRDLNVVLPTEAPGREESSVDIKTPEFSTDEEQSPKEYESNVAEEKSYDENTNGDKEAKNFTDEAPMKTEQREAGQKASPKKHNILSGVGLKVKHQLAKVKKAIIGKPGHTKSELPKS